MCPESGVTVPTEPGKSPARSPALSCRGRGRGASPGAGYGQDSERRGHTPGSIALRHDDPGGSTHLFTGDSLFPGGPGRTTNVIDFTSLMDDLEERVFGPLPDDTWFYPGHGNDSTLGTERPSIPEWRARGW